MKIEQQRQFRRDGFAILHGAVPESECRQLEDLMAGLARQIRASAEKSHPHGIRHLFSRSPELGSRLGSSPFAEIAESALGAPARPVKGTFFDKNTDANWPVPRHQDLTISVREHDESQRAALRGFEHWSVKDGVVHVQPPISVLESMVALRLHLDDCPAANGALRVVPGSHRGGRLEREQIEEQHRLCGEVVCELRRGDILLMSPLIVHASPRAVEPRHRRVLHVEWSSKPLPVPLDWAGPTAEP